MREHYPEYIKDHYCNRCRRSCTYQKINDKLGSFFYVCVGPPNAGGGCGAILEVANMTDLDIARIVIQKREENADYTPNERERLALHRLKARADTFGMGTVELSPYMRALLRLGD